jgi:hypothetical protein
MRRVDNFKLYLDDNILEQDLANQRGRSRPEYQVGTREDVEGWYLDYLVALRKYLQSYIAHDLGLSTLASRKVRYLFSVPVMWDNAVVKRFERIAKEAGFGQERRHSVEISLTEAEAAAVYTVWSKRHWNSFDDYQLREGHVLLVCDSGGGTTARTSACLLAW